ncbi:MAG: hypothetical protein L6262_02585 [Weeksellaceae bacterium]|nr:hypothetical protein [Weeksellaceae bacterium]
MKISNKLFLLLVLMFNFSTAYSQKITTQEIDKPRDGKSLVYILRTGAGPLLNFRIYDKDRFLGALSGFKYMVYECDPGAHVFWAASENRDFVEANLEPNAVYVLNAEGQMGAFIAQASLNPLNPNEFRDKRTFYQVVKGAKKQIYVPATDDKTENIKSGLEKYQSLKTSNSKKIKVLTADMKFQNADKPAKN